MSRRPGICDPQFEAWLVSLDHDQFGVRAEWSREGVIDLLGEDNPRPPDVPETLSALGDLDVPDEDDDIELEEYLIWMPPSSVPVGGYPGPLQEGVVVPFGLQVSPRSAWMSFPVISASFTRDGYYFVPVGESTLPSRVGPNRTPPAISRPTFDVISRADRLLTMAAGLLTEVEYLLEPSQAVPNDTNGSENAGENGPAGNIDDDAEGETGSGLFELLGGFFNGHPELEIVSLGLTWYLDDLVLPLINE